MNGLGDIIVLEVQDCVYAGDEISVALAKNVRKIVVLDIFSCAPREWLTLTP
jgi:hypothetical protein